MHLLEMMLLTLLMSIASLGLPSLNGQDPPNTEEAYDSLYNINIRLSSINGVYIPKDLDEAHDRIIELSPAESLGKFARAPEAEVASKLHFGIGRWMIINWNFYEGSRLSHYLKQKGLLHPDDMAQFVLRTLHRKLNEKPLDTKSLIEELAELRMEEVEEVYKN